MVICSFLPLSSVWTFEVSVRIFLTNSTLASLTVVECRTVDHVAALWKHRWGRLRPFTVTEQTVASKWTVMGDVSWHYCLIENVQKAEKMDSWRDIEQTRKKRTIYGIRDEKHPYSYLGILAYSFVLMLTKNKNVKLCFSTTHGWKNAHTSHSDIQSTLS